MVIRSITQVVFAAGRLHPQKGFSDLIHSIYLSLPTNPNIRLIIAGIGLMHDSLLSQATSLGISNYIQLVGYHPELTAFYQYSSIFVCSSLWEGFGNVIVEALSCGTTVVSTDCPGGPSFILDYGKYGYLTPVANPSALSQSILRALSCPMNPDLLIERARSFLTTFIASEYLTILSSFSSGPHEA